MHMLRIIHELSQDNCCEPCFIVYITTKVYKDFVIVLLEKDQYDFYQVGDDNILDVLPSLNFMKGDTLPLSYVQRFFVQLGHHLKTLFASHN
jgi:hypothetical protein